MTGITNAPGHTPRFSLPYLSAAQAQKEITHNEALQRINSLLSPMVEGIGANPDYFTPQPGQCWIVATDAVGDWTGKAEQIACFDENGWMFITVTAGQRVYSQDIAAEYFHDAQGWVVPSSPVAPEGGDTIDLQARQALQQLQLQLTQMGILPSGM